MTAQQRRPGELLELRRTGDLMQSALSRLLEAVEFDGLAYEARMAFLEGADSIHDWTRIRSASVMDTEG